MGNWAKITPIYSGSITPRSGVITRLISVFGPTLSDPHQKFQGWICATSWAKSRLFWGFTYWATYLIMTYIHKNIYPLIMSQIFRLHISYIQLINRVCCTSPIWSQGPLHFVPASLNGTSKRWRFGLKALAFRSFFRLVCPAPEVI